MDDRRVITIVHLSLGLRCTKKLTHSFIVLKLLCLTHQLTSCSPTPWVCTCNARHAIKNQTSIADEIIDYVAQTKGFGVASSYSATEKTALLVLFRKRAIKHSCLFRCTITRVASCYPLPYGSLTPLERDGGTSSFRTSYIVSLPSSSLVSSRTQVCFLLGACDCDLAPPPPPLLGQGIGSYFNFCPPPPF